MPCHTSRSRPSRSRRVHRSPCERSEPPGRNAAHCPGRPLQRQGHPTLERRNLCRPSGPDGEGQARGQAQEARGETSTVTRRTGGGSGEALDSMVFALCRIPVIRCADGRTPTPPKEIHPVSIRPTGSMGVVSRAPWRAPQMASDSSASLRDRDTKRTGARHRGRSQPLSSLATLAKGATPRDDRPKDISG